MQLTEDERAALERLRLVDFGKDERDVYGGMTEHGYRGEGNTFADRKYLANAMLRLFPVRTYGDLVIRWDDEITPERLVACGFTRKAIWLCHGDIDYACIHNRAIGMRYLGSHIHVHLAPRNMGEVWQLMERCGVEEGGK